MIELGQLVALVWFGQSTGVLFVVKGEVKEDFVFFFSSFPSFLLMEKKVVFFLVSRQTNITISFILEDPMCGKYEPTIWF